MSFFVTISLLLAGVVAQAQLQIGVSFTGRGDCADTGCSTLAPATVAGVLPQANWNNVNNSATFNGTSGALTDSNGVATSVTLTYDANDSWNNDQTPVVSGDEQMMKGISKSSGTTHVNNYTFNNVPAGYYDVLVYINVNGDNRAVNVSCNGVTYYAKSQHQFGGTFIRSVNQDPYGVRDLGNYVRFSGVYIPAGPASLPIGVYNSAENDGVGVAGFQLVPATGPSLVSASTVGNPNLVRVKFSGAMDATALNPANYALDGGVTVSAAAFESAASNIVQLTTTTLTVGSTYNVTVTGVLGITGTAQVPEPSAASFVYGSEFPLAGLTMRRYDGDGSLIGNKNKIAACVAPQRQTINLATFAYGTNPSINNDVPDGNMENYGTWVYGQFIAPTTGNYRFAISSDDSSELYLSTDENPLNKVLLTSEPGCCAGFTAHVSGLIPLVAGKSYYMEAVHQEGGGGDSVQVAMQAPGDPAIVDGQAPIAGSFFAQNRVYTGACPQFTFKTIGPVSLFSDIGSVNVVENNLYTFKVGIDGTPGYSAQWYSNGVPVAGTLVGTNASLSFTVRAANAGNTFYVVVNNSFSSVTSSVATLSVTLAPQMLAASSRNDPSGNIYVTWSKDMGPAAANPASYTVDNGVTVSAAAFHNGDPRLVRLSVSALTAGVTYNVTGTGITDPDSNIMNPNPTVRSFTHLSGINAPQGLSMKRFDGSGDFNTIRNKILSCATPQRESTTMPDFEYTTSEAGDLVNGNLFLDGNTENYGTWVYGLYVAPTTGNYRFILASDDHGELYLSTDSTPANKVLISQTPAWNGYRNFVTQNDPGSSLPIPSGLIPLVAGKRYYMEAIVQEGGGGDHVAVAVQLPGGPAIVNGSANVISRDSFATNYSVGCPPSDYFNNLGPVVIAEQPATTTVFELATATFRVLLDGSPNYTYQWRSNGVPVPGANGPVYSFNPLRYANGAVYTVVAANGFSSVTSAPAVLNVTSDEILPTVVNVLSAPSRTVLGIIFSEPLTLLQATNPANYVITNSAGVVLAHSASVLPEVSPDGKSVTLRTASQTAGAQYGLVINNLTDRAGVPNVIVSPTVKLFTASDLLYAPGVVLFRAYPTGGGNAIAELTNHPSYLNNQPDFEAVINGMNSRLAPSPYNNNGRDNYGGAVLGHFIPPVSGNYIFYISADDDGLLKMNTNGPNSSGASVVRFAPGCCRALANGSDPTPPISLLAGQAYYIEALLKEGGGGDYVEVGARLVGDNSAITIIGSANLAFASKLTINQNPTNLTVIEGQNASFNLGVSVAGAGVGSQRYQWQRSEDPSGMSFTNIPGATAATYTFRAFEADDQIQFRCVAELPGLQTETSSAAVLTILQDTIAPVLLSARVTEDRTQIILTYSEAIDPNAGSDASNFYLDTGVPSAVTREVNGSSIRLTFDGQIPVNTSFILTGDGQYDEFGNPTDPASTLTTIFVFEPFGLKHRYSFFNPAGAAGGSNVIDSVSRADGTVLGAGANFTGSRLTIPGGASATAGYVDLPNRILSTNGAANGGSGQVTIEAWIKVTGVQSWARIFDFGNSTVGENTGPGGGGDGDDYFFYSASVANNNGLHQLEVREVDPDPDGTTLNVGTSVQIPTATAGTDLYFVITWDEAAGQLRAYENGVQVGSLLSVVPMSKINDVNVWLGRSQWSGDANMQGEYDEFRIYNRILTTGEMAFNRTVGPNNSFGTPLAVRIVVETNVMLENVSQQARVFADFATATNVDLTVTRTAPIISDNPGVLTVSPTSLLTAGIGVSGFATLTASFAGVSATPVVIEVLQDTFPPVAVRARPVSATEIEITFNEPMNPGPIAEASNWQVYGPSGQIDILSTAATAPNRALITLASAMPCELITIVMDGLLDLASSPNAIEPGSTISFVNLSAGLEHRYSFNNPAGSANGGVLTDSVGGADGAVRGNGASFSGSRFSITGGASASAPYGDLPNGIFSKHGLAKGGSGQATIEGWVKVTGGRTWGRIFDFGSSSGAELTGPGGGGNGWRYVMLSAQVGDDVNNHRFEINGEGAGAFPNGFTQDFPASFNQDTHFAVTWNELTDTIQIFRNGTLVHQRNTPVLMSDVQDVNVWLGRSTWTGDQNMQGEFDEFRIYDRALSAAEVAFNSGVGPNIIAGAPLAVHLQVPSTTVTENQFQQATVLADYPGNPGVNITALGCYTIYSSDNSVVAGSSTGGLQADNPGVANVYVAFGGQTSTVTQITVEVDTTKPTILSVQGVSTFDAVKVTFSELVEASSAQEISNYYLTDTNANEIPLNSATLSPDGKTVTLGVPTHAAGLTLVLTASGVNDRANSANFLDETNITFETWVLSDGFVKFEAFLNLIVPDYQNPQPVIDAINNGVTPSFSFYTNVVNWPQSTPDLNNYGMHFAGLFRAPISGTYKFEPASDDSGNLLFSPDDRQSNAVVVMDFDCCSGFGAGEPGYTVDLVAGQSYWFDLRVVEAGGGDIAGLSVTLPGGLYLAPIPATLLTVPVAPNGNLAITTQPANVAFNLLTDGAADTTFASVTFNANNEGFVASALLATDGPWVYDNGSGSWKTAGQAAENGHGNTVLLTSPSIPVPGAGALRLTFAHRYSFEGGEWDGGQVRYSVNGGPFVTVPASAFLSNGYSGTVLGNSSSTIAGQSAFVNESAGHGAATMITSSCDLATVNPGDTVQVQFVAASDSNSTGNQPVWEITSGSLSIRGAPPTFSVATAASNAQDGANPPRFYQWYRNDGAGFVAIPGANSASYSLNPCLGDNGAQFQVKVSIVGETPVLSSIATLTVSGVVTASVTPVNANINPGGSGVLTAVTTARNPSYLWSPGGQTTASVTNSPGVTTTYTVTITDGVTLCTYSAEGKISLPDMFMSGAPLLINDNAAASPYPSTINVAGLTALISKVTVSLNDLSHSWPDDIDLMLVGPQGQKVQLMSDAGGGFVINNVDLTFDAAAGGPLPDETPISSGTYLPSNFFKADVFPPPAPAGPYGSLLSAFNGTDPNGTWSLYIVDDEAGDSGSLAGWSLKIWTDVPFADVRVSLAGPSSVQRGTPITYTISVLNAGPATALNVNVQDVLPAGVTFVSATASQGSAVNNAGTVNAALGSMAAGSSATVTIVVTPTALGTLNNGASVTSTTFDLNLANNTAPAISTTVVAPLYISVNFPGGHEFGSPTTLAPGEIAGVTPLFNWNNIGGGDNNSVNNAPLTDYQAQPTTVTIYYTADENWGSGAGTATPDQKMLNGTLGISNDGHYRPLLLNNVPNRAYKLLMYNVQRDNSAQAYTVNGDTANTLHITTQNGAEYNAGNTWIRGTSTNANARDLCNYVQFDEVAPVNGTITIDCRSESFRANMNGIQLISLEPGAFRFLPQPGNVTIAEGGNVNFYGNTVDGTGAVTYQWLTNGVADTVNGLSQNYALANVNYNGNGRTFTLIATDSTSQSITSSVAVMTVLNGAKLLSATSAGRNNQVFAHFGAAVALTGTYTINNGVTVLSAAYGATHSDVVLTTSVLTEDTVYAVTATGETRDDNGDPTEPTPTSVSFFHGFGRLCTDFASLPAGSALFNNGVNGSGVLADDGTGTNMAVHLTDDGNNGAYGKLYISNRMGGDLLKVLQAKWRTRIGGELGGHADGMSFNWASDLVPNGNFIATDEGEGTGVSFTIDTWDGGSGPDTGIEIKWQQSRIAFLHIPRSFEGNANYICKDVFVDTSASVSAEGLAVFTYNGNTISAMIPGWAGIANGAYAFAARTGGENDNMWIDDLCINDFTLGPVFFTVEPVQTTVLEGLAATFSAAVDGTPSYFYQWKSNGVPIAGATGATYTTPPVTGAYEGQVYSVTASNSFSSVTSSNAALHVVINPRVVSVFSQNDNQVHVVYTRPVDLASGYYDFSGGVFEIDRAYGSSSNEVVVTTDPLTVGTYTVTITDVADAYNSLSLILPNPTVASFYHGYGSVCADFAAGLPAGASTIGSAVVSGGSLHLTDAVNSQQGNFFLPDQNGGFPLDRLLVSFKTLIGGGTCCGARYADGMSFNVASDINAGSVYGEEGAGSGLTITFDTWDNAAPDTAPAIEVRYKGITVGYQSMAGIREGDRAPDGPFIYDAGGPLSLDTSNQFVNVQISVGPDGKLDLYFKDRIIFNKLQLPNYTPFVGANFGFGARTGGANENAWIDNLCINAFSLGAVAITQQPADVTVPELPQPRVSFIVGVDGLPPYTVQWYSNGVPVAGATALAYTTPPLNLAASGSGYSAIIGNSFGSVTSRVAVVTILPDAPAPVALTLVRDAAGNATISWPGVGWRLQATTILNSNPGLTVWQDQPFPSGTVIPAGYFGPGNTNIFFRLIYP